MKVKDAGHRRAAQHHPHPHPHPHPTPRSPAGAQSRPGAGQDGRPLSRGVERELKFTVPDSAAPAVLRDVLAQGATAERFCASYHDTPDGRLAKAGIAMRLRREGERWTQTLKLSPGGLSPEREEHEVGIVAPADGDVRLDPVRHEGSTALAAVRAALAGHGGFEALAERFTTDVTRHPVELAVGASCIALAYDEGAVRAGDRETPLRELEFELVDGRMTDLADEAAAWIARHGVWLAGEAKSQRGARLVGWSGSGQAGKPVKARALQLDAQAGAQAALQQIVRNCLEQILPNAAVVAGGSRDAASVHQLRVGLRRLRTALRELGGLSPALDAAWEAPVADTFRRLGEFRDQGAVLEGLRPQLQAAGAPHLGWTEQQASAVDPVAAVRDAAFQTALVRLIGFAFDDALPDADVPPLRRTLRQRLRALHRHVGEDGARFHKLRPERQHQVRKRLKRLRYLSEFAASLFPDRKVSRYLARLEPAQDALGQHNDLVVALDLSRQAAGRGEAGADFAVDWLGRQRKGPVRQSRRTLEKVAQARRFWKKKR